MVCVLAIGARSWVGLPDWAAAGIIAVWVIKDVVMFPFVRIAYQPGSGDGPTSLIGARGTAEDALRPAVYIEAVGATSAFAARSLRSKSLKAAAAAANAPATEEKE